MAKQSFKPGNMLYPVPVVMISVKGKGGEDNIITVAWTGTVCSDPPMASISVRPERHSYQMIKESGEFVINLTTRDLVFATDYCGVKSGRDVDKFKEMKLTKGKAQVVKAPLIEESPVNLECRVVEVKELGVHHMFLAEIVAVNVDDKYMDDKYMDETNKFHLEQADLIAYSHGSYYSLGDLLGSFGFSVRKK